MTLLTKNSIRKKLQAILNKLTEYAINLTAVIFLYLYQKAHHNQKSTDSSLWQGQTIHEISVIRNLLSNSVHTNREIDN